MNAIHTTPWRVCIMRIHQIASALLLGCCCLAGAAWAEDVASSSVTGEHSLVVAGQGYFPVLLRLQDGRIAVVLRGGAAHVGIAGRLDMVFSANEGQTWSA